MVNQPTGLPLIWHGLQCETQLTVLFLCPNIRRTKSGTRTIHIHNRRTREFASGAACQSLNGCAAHSSRRLLTLGLKTCYVLTPFTSRFSEEFILLCFLTYQGFYFQHSM